MEDFRFLEENSMWIWIIIAFLLLTSFKGCNSLGGLNCLFGNLFDGCNSTWMWVIIAILVYFFFTKSCGGGIFRNELQ